MIIIAYVDLLHGTVTCSMSLSSWASRSLLPRDFLLPPPDLVTYRAASTGCL